MYTDEILYWCTYSDNWVNTGWYSADWCTFFCKLKAVPVFIEDRNSRCRTVMILLYLPHISIDINI